LITLWLLNTVLCACGPASTHAPLALAALGLPQVMRRPLGRYVANAAPAMNWMEEEGENE
jgi:hypothetical protein